VTLDDRLTISTPEGVDLELVLAGLGSRFPAALLDTVVQAVAIFALSIIFSVAGGSGVLLAAYFVAVFLVLFGYDVAFETLNAGRTLGKLAAGVRVVRLDGSRVGFVTSAVRNLLRLIDFLPALYAVGTVAMIATARHQRLGDLAAGTIVVRDQRGAPASVFSLPPPSPTPASPGASGVATLPTAETAPPWDVSAVTAWELGAVQQFLARRMTLTPAARVQLGADLATRLRSKVAGVPGDWPPEAFLEGLVSAKFARG
jgi:uncharacterized RDD family membrane protein YckC